MIKINDKAPEFKLKDQNGKDHKLSDFKGKKIILYFYPKDMTPGCTVEACDFRDNLDQFKQKNTVVLGVSADSVERHKKFEQKHDLNFILLSDENKEVLKSYNVWQEKKFMGKTYMGIVRTTYLIDEKGIITDIIEKVRVKGHVDELLI
jgi:thioredoxin-dependent peroxiredoxin